MVNLIFLVSSYSTYTATTYFSLRSRPLGNTIGTNKGLPLPSEPCFFREIANPVKLEFITIPPALMGIWIGNQSDVVATGTDSAGNDKILAIATIEVSLAIPCLSQNEKDIGKIVFFILLVSAYISINQALYWGARLPAASRQLQCLWLFFCISSPARRHLERSSILTFGKSRDETQRCGTSLERYSCRRCWSY